MKENHNTTTVQKLVIMSRRIFWSAFVCFFLSGAISIGMMYLQLIWSWLEALAKMLLLYTYFMLAISWLTPGLLIIFGAPKFVHAWLLGINPVGFSNKPWEELPSDEKFSVYLTGIAFSAFTVLAIFIWILEYLKG